MMIDTMSYDILSCSYYKILCVYNTYMQAFSRKYQTNTPCHDRHTHMYTHTYVHTNSPLLFHFHSLYYSSCWAVYRWPPCYWALQPDMPSPHSGGNQGRQKSSLQGHPLSLTRGQPCHGAWHQPHQLATVWLSLCFPLVKQKKEDSSQSSAGIEWAVN